MLFVNCVHVVMIAPALSLIVTSWTTPVETVHPGATFMTVALMLTHTPLSNKVTVTIETSMVFGGSMYSNVNRRVEAVKVVAALIWVSKSSVRLFLIAQLVAFMGDFVSTNSTNYFCVLQSNPTSLEGLCAIIPGLRFLYRR